MMILPHVETLHKTNFILKIKFPDRSVSLPCVWSSIFSVFLLYSTLRNRSFYSTCGVLLVGTLQINLIQTTCTVSTPETLQIHQTEVTCSAQRHRFTNFRQSVARRKRSSHNHPKSEQIISGWYQIKCPVTVWGFSPWISLWRVHQPSYPNNGFPA